MSVLTASGQAWETKDFEAWMAASAAPPARAAAEASALPEPAALVQAAAGRLYASGNFAWSSDDDGRTWRNLTQFAKFSILGGPLADLAISPTNPDDIAVANGNGVWRSLDGGLSWESLNALLPNLPAARLLRAPQMRRGLILGLSTGDEAEWVPGERAGWRRAEPGYTLLERALAVAHAARLGAVPARISSAGSYVYAGSSEGRLFASTDEGANWRIQICGTGKRGIHLRRRTRAAHCAGRDYTGELGTARLFRTTNGGIFWDDLSEFTHRRGARRRLIWRRARCTLRPTRTAFDDTNLRNASPATRWERSMPTAARPGARRHARRGRQPIRARPGGPWVYCTMRLTGVDPRVVNAADFSRGGGAWVALSVWAAFLRAADRGARIGRKRIESQIGAIRANGATLSRPSDEPRGRSMALQCPLSPAIFADATNNHDSRRRTRPATDAQTQAEADSDFHYRAWSRLTGLTDCRPWKVCHE
jgi:hypothetical protein